MATVILVRHGRTTANATGVLAGRLPGVRLDDRGTEQAVATAERLAPVRLVAAVSSPLERCKQTTRAITRAQAGDLAITTERRLSECDYGEWQGRELKDLAKEPLWKVVQGQPSAAAFPGGESMRAMQDRAVEAVRRHDRLVEAEHGPGAVWLAVSHGDVIKAILADALGTAPRPLPAHPGRPGVGVDRALHRVAPLRPGHQHVRGRPVLAQPAAGEEGVQASSYRGCAGRRRCRTGHVPGWVLG